MIQKIFLLLQISFLPGLHAADRAVVPTPQNHALARLSPDLFIDYRFESEQNFLWAQRLDNNCLCNNPFIITAQGLVGSALVATGSGGIARFGDRLSSTDFTIAIVCIVVGCVLIIAMCAPCFLRTPCFFATKKTVLNRSRGRRLADDTLVGGHLHHFIHEQFPGAPTGEMLEMLGRFFVAQDGEYGMVNVLTSQRPVFFDRELLGEEMTRAGLDDAAQAALWARLEQFRQFFENLITADANALKELSPGIYHICLGDTPLPTTDQGWHTAALTYNITHSGAAPVAVPVEPAPGGTADTRAVDEADNSSDGGWSLV